MAFGVLSMASFAHAQASLNNPGSMPTITVTNHTTRPCNMGPIDGCWTTSASARPGDIVAVHIYYKNTGDDLAEGTTLGLNPRATTSTTSVTFRGGVASLTAPRATGSANVSLSESATVTYIPGSARWYPSANSGGQSVDESGLFGQSGFNIGTLYPGEQGVLVAQFRVGEGNGDGDSNCRIDNFDADDTSINEGDSARLRWNTTGCDSAKINQGVGTVALDGTRTVSPRTTTTYTLSAYDANGDLADTDTVRITVDEDNNDSCSIDNFEADDYSLNSGDSTVLRWTTTGADTVDLNPGYRNRADDGSVTIRPSRTTTYTLDIECTNGNSKSRNLTVTVGDKSTSAPQAITTVATILSSTSAQLNGIGIPNTSTGTTRAWFEWGPSSSLGFRTGSQTITSNSSTNYSDVVNGLVPGTVYYYRAVVENQNGTAHGDIVRFQTRSTVITTTTPRTTTVVRTQAVRDVVVAQSAPSLLELSVESTYDTMCVNGSIDYTVTYRNISTQTLQAAVLQVTHQKEVTFISSSRGDYDVVDRTITVDLGSIAPGETGTILVHGRVNDLAASGTLTVMTAQVVYTNTITRAQENAIAYSLVTISNDCPNVFGASAYRFGSFLPDTLLEWLLLILVILALIVLGRQLYKKKEVRTTTY